MATLFSPGKSNDFPYKEVAAQWSKRRSEYRRATRWVWLVYWLGVAICTVPFVIGLVPLGNGAWLLVFVAAAIGLDLRQDYIRYLKCPNCGQHVVISMWGKSPFFEPTECQNCEFPLIMNKSK